MRSLTSATLGLIVSLRFAGAIAADLTPTLSANHTPLRHGVEGGLWMLSEQCERAIAQSPRRVDDAALESYLHDIVCRLSPDYCADIRVYVVRTPYFNASMMPNGAMQVWTGLLARVRNEAQLAAVLGHELGHYLRRHGLQQMEDVRLRSNLLTFFTLGLGAAVAGGGIGAGTAQAASLGAHFGTLGSLFAFSREHETEADLFGLRLLAEAGYSPDAAPAVWQDLIDEERADDGKSDSRLPFFTTHPAPEKRMTALRMESGRSTATPTINEIEARERYLAAVRFHLREWLEDELALNHPKKSELLLRRMLDVEFAPGIVHYLLGEVSRREDTGSLSTAALEHYEVALTFPDAPPEAHRAIGLWKLKSKDMPSARTHLASYLAAAPDASDRAMIEYYLTQMGPWP